MALVGKSYSLEDFNKLIFSENQYILPESVFAVFKTIESSIDIPTFTAPVSNTSSHYENTFPNKRDRDNSDGYTRDRSTHSSSSKPRDSGSRKPKKDSPPSTEDWGMMRNFKTTKMEAKSGVDKTINDLRIHLNKLSAANYTKQRDTIIAELRQYIDSGNSTSENNQKVASAIFQIVSSNKFLSELYSELYSELMREFSLFGDLLGEFIASFHETVRTIEYINPDENYDEFCRITKANDRRKSTTLFIANIMKKGVLSVQVVMDLLNKFLQSINMYVREPERVNHVEEIAENIYILISSCSAEFKQLPEWKLIFPTILLFSNKDVPPEFVSTSNRIMFKFMDILDSTK
jgi:hypothetical protein